MNWYKKLGLIVVAITVLTMGAGIASAQEPPRDHARFGVEALIAALADLTGLTPRELLVDLTPETTIADIAARHGVDPAATVAQAAERITTAMAENVAAGRMEQAEADRILETLEADLTDIMGRPLPPPQARQQNIREASERALFTAMMDLTGLDMPALQAQAREQGLTTLATIVEANGVSSEDVITAAIAKATEAANQAVANGHMSQAQADQVLAGLEEAYTNAMQRPLPQPQEVRQAAERALITALTELTGLDIPQLQQQAREQGLTTMAEMAGANGVTTAAVIAAGIENATEIATQAVAEGRMTQAQADQILAGLEEAYTEAVQHPLPLPQPQPQQQQGPAADFGRTILQTAAELTGQVPADLRQQMRDGTPLVDILTASGVDPATVVDTVVGQVTERLEQQVWDFMNRIPTEPAPQPPPAQ